MGSFINTSYKDIVTSIHDITKEVIKNPYYPYNDKKPSFVTYYHINTEKSTMDEYARIPYDELNVDCPFRFNRIKDFVVYGLEKIQVSLDNSDQGLESGDITGEIIILPGTITPYPGDYFEINQIKDSTWLFRVNDVQKDTLDDGANIWKILYKLEHTDNTRILDLVDDEDNYNMLITNVGTRYNPIITSTKYELLKALDELCVGLKKYYKELFYSSRVQTFIFCGHMTDYFYDAFMIEFLIRNNIMGNHGEYLYVDHKIKVPNTFSLDYNKTFFRSFEMKDKKHLSIAIIESTADYINVPMSIFHTRPENYFSLNYKVYSFDTVNSVTNLRTHNVIQCFPREIINAIINGELFLREDKNAVYNTIIKYFNDIDLDDKDLDFLEYAEYIDTIEIFYLLPLLIFCIERFVEKNLLK